MTSLLSMRTTESPSTDSDTRLVDLDDLAGTYRRSRVLFAAIELDVFEFTRCGRSVAETERHAGLHPRSARIFLDSLVGLGLLTRSSDDVYENSATAERYLVSSSPQFLGVDLLEQSRRSYCSWNWLTEALRTGEPQAEPIFTRRDPSRVRRSVVFDRFVELTDLPGASSWSVVATDGALAVPLAIAHPSSSGNVVTPDSAHAPAVRAQLVLAGVDRRVAVSECDVFAGRLPPTALYVVDGLRDYSATERERLLDRVRSAMPGGGMLVVVDEMIGNERNRSTSALLSALDALVEGTPTLCYTASEFDRWCRAAGFARTEIAPLTGVASAAIAYTTRNGLR
jgi:hypothetical protein